MLPNKHKLTVNKLSCRRGNHCLWQNLEFAVSPGELLQITGANGSGKTSLLRILAGLAPPDSGTVHWQGLPIAYLGHQLAVKAELTVQENLRFQMQTTTANTRLAALEQMGLTAHLDHFGYQLSQGQKQRLALARLLINPALLWILDEPLAGLDAEMTEKVAVLMTQHVQQGGLIVFTTHRPLTFTRPVQTVEMPS